MQATTTNTVIGHEFLNQIQNDEAILRIVKGQIPIFVCERNGKGGLSFKCPHCNRKHHHKAGNGFRSAHCFRKPPLFTQGYYLLEKDAADQVVPAEKLHRMNLKSFLEGLNGKMVGIDFIKQDGSARALTGRLGVTAPLKGGQNKVEAPDRPYLTVYEVGTGYRTVNLETTSRVRANGKVYDIVG
jgi:hypothetical protein